MKTRDVEQIIAPPPTHMVGSGFKVHNFFPSMIDMYRMSPFFLLDYNARTYFPPSNIPRGVGVHPHRGFETVTLAYHGKVAHHDSTGAGGVIEEGDLQWMTAGSGILHKEYHEEKFNKAGGDFQMAQVWVNLPKKDKMTPPKYQTISHGQIPNSQLPDGAGIVEVIAGSYNGTQGAASTFSPIEFYNIKLNKNGKATIELPENYNTGVLIVEGNVVINAKETAPANHFVLLKNNGDSFTLEAEDHAIVLVLSGKPLNEPIVASGPFVMNTREEILQAYEDFDNGKFGRLDD